MNFSPAYNLLPTSFSTTLPTTGVKFQGTVPQGQVLGMLGADAVHYLGGGQPQPQLITLPLTVSGKADGEQQPQAIQIQVVNTGTTPSAATGAKFVMPIQIQGFPQGAATVLTLAYNQAGPGEPLQLQFQPQMTSESNNNDAIQTKVESDNDDKGTQTMDTKMERMDASEEEDVNAEPEPDEGDTPWSPPTMPLSLHHFLKFSSDSSIRRDASSSDSPQSDSATTTTTIGSMDDPKVEITKKNNKRRHSKPRSTKGERVKKMRPGQVRIATALDGTTLFCCPECQMAYPDKELLEQHLLVHKIERRFICDTCGAGLKRKEHLERHKLGHNPERPYICPVCNKGFKRKEHLNLHSVIHSGSKSEVCTECGKGFYRKDHLRKHAKSHMTKKMKEAAQAQAQTILEAQQLAQTTQVQVQIPNMPGLSVIPISTVSVKTEMDEDEDDVIDEPDEDYSESLPDVGGASPSN